MSLSFPLFFQPTFTQGLIIGQLSILLLLGAILKYLFFEQSQDDTLQAATPSPYQGDEGAFLRHRHLHAQKTAIQDGIPESETTEWLSVLMKQVSLNRCRRSFGHIHWVQVVDVYRTKIRGGFEGIEGDETARRRVEDYANSVRPKGFLVRPAYLSAQPILRTAPRTTSLFIPSILESLHQYFIMRMSKENKKMLY
jgi:maintenance of morphology protein 1